MKNRYLVNEIAKFFDVTTDTIRYYDKLDIIKPDKNEENKYRYYSREDLISFSYVFLLKKLGLSLKHIEVLLNHNSLDTSISILNKRKEEIEETIKELNMVKDMIDDYNQSNINTYSNLDNINIDDNVFILYQEINEKHPFNLIIKQFEELELNKIPLFTFCFEKEVFLSVNFKNAMISKYNSKFAISIKTNKNDIVNKEKLRNFKVFNPNRCFVTTIKCHTNKDYSSYARLKDLLEENNLVVNGVVLYRAVSFRNNINDNHDYYEIYIPIE